MKVLGDFTRAVLIDRNTRLLVEVNGGLEGEKVGYI